MEQKFLRVFNELTQHLKKPRILVAVSGGLDSMVLLALLRKAKAEVLVAHCNFQLRGAESDADEALVKRTAADYAYELFVNKFNTEREVKNRKQSTQVVARALRYDWFAEVMQEQVCDFLLTAHHANDHFETAVYNFIKGSGVAGLRGIKPVSGHIIRPLLNFEKAEIEAYAKEHKVQWREDLSNQSLKYNRNYIRHVLLPGIKKINPSAVRTYFYTASRLSAIEKIIEKRIAHLYSEYTQEGNLCFPYSAAQDEEKFLTFKELLYTQGYDPDSLYRFMQTPKNNSGSYVESKESILWRDRKYWILQKKSEIQQVEPTTFDSEGKYFWGNYTFEVRKHKKLSFKILKERQNSVFIPVRFAGPFVLRSWNEGDKIQPFGMKGSTLVSKIFIDQKVPAFKKNNIPLLSFQGEILTVCGLKNSEKLRMDGDVMDCWEILWVCK